jgi:class 3 adenylate cyclase
MGTAVKVVLFSKKPNPTRAKLPRRSRRGPEVEAYPFSHMRRVLPILEGGLLVYADVSGLSDVERIRAIALLAKRPGLLFGLIDPAGKVSDPASLFHAGAVDYIGREFRRTGLTAKRLERVLAFAEAGRPRAGAEPEQPAEPPASLEGWPGVVPGRESPFAFLYVEVDGAEDMKRRYGQENLSHALDTFRAFIERLVALHEGRIWMWTGFGGLALFPLRATDTRVRWEPSGGCSPVVCGLRIAMSRIFFDVEESPLPSRLCFRMALSVGSTIYRETDTGGIVSDSLNSIFHLGQKFVRPGQFLLTEEALDLAPQRLRGACVPAGSFEGRRIHRMVTPWYPTPKREGECTSVD